MRGVEIGADCFLSNLVSHLLRGVHRLDLRVVGGEEHVLEVVTQRLQVHRLGIFALLLLFVHGYNIK